MDEYPDIVSSEVMQILGLTDQSVVSRMVHAGQLTPTRKLPGKRGQFLFSRADVIALAVERKQRHEEAAARLDDAIRAAS